MLCQNVLILFTTREYTRNSTLWETHWIFVAAFYIKDTEINERSLMIYTIPRGRKQRQQSGFVSRSE